MNRAHCGMTFECVTVQSNHGDFCYIDNNGAINSLLSKSTMHDHVPNRHHYDIESTDAANLGSQLVILEYTAKQAQGSLTLTWKLNLIDPCLGNNLVIDPTIKLTPT